jgi:hypothetical protein
MSTNGMTSWAVDLKDVAAVYPFQGSEALLVVLGVLVWIGFHILQIRNERREVAHDLAADPKGDKTREAIDRY